MTENDKSKDETKDTKPQEKPVEVPPVETQHQIKAGGNTLKYTTAAGLMPIKNESGDIEASLFFTAYTLNGVDDSAKRPLTFVFNGGPGSASVWLHLGAVGPKRVKMEDEGWMPAPPYQLLDNDHTWLDLTDLVFIDPVGTGFSRAARPDDNKKYWSLTADLESVGEFIRLYLSRNKRWTSPLFLAGESYGTTRAAGLSEHLFDKYGIALNGVLLISTVLNFQTILFRQGNDLPYSLYIPTYAATAWYHKRLPADLQAKTLEEVIAEVEAWSEGDYTQALAKGAGLSQRERVRIATQLARYTGLDRRYLEGTNLRIDIMRFCKELLREESRAVGRLDSRFKRKEELAITEFPEFDPSYSAILSPYSAMINQYVRAELGYETDLSYEILSRQVNAAWEYERGMFPDTSEALRGALAKNPHMKVFVGQGYFDLATPHFAARYTVNHLGIPDEQQANFQHTFYEAGHMMYLDTRCLAKLKDDVGTFFKFAFPG